MKCNVQLQQVSENEVIVLMFITSHSNNCRSIAIFSLRTKFLICEEEASLFFKFKRITHRRHSLLKVLDIRKVMFIMCTTYL